jgi:hypothetical protein
VAKLSPQEAAVLLAAASTREDVVDTIVRFARGLADSVMVFTVREGMALGWRGAGAQLPVEMVESIMLPLNVPSMFAQAVDTRAPVAGAMPETTLHRHLLKALRRDAPPRSMAVVPVVMLDRAVNLVYVDRLQAGDVSEVVGALVELATRVSAAYQRIVRESKIKKPAR